MSQGLVRTGIISSADSHAMVHGCEESRKFSNVEDVWIISLLEDLSKKTLVIFTLESWKWIRVWSPVWSSISQLPFLPIPIPPNSHSSQLPFFPILPIIPSIPYSSVLFWFPSAPAKVSGVGVQVDIREGLRSLSWVKVFIGSQLYGELTLDQD